MRKLELKCVLFLNLPSTQLVEKPPEPVCVGDALLFLAFIIECRVDLERESFQPSSSWSLHNFFEPFEVLGKYVELAECMLFEVLLPASVDCGVVRLIMVVGFTGEVMENLLLYLPGEKAPASLHVELTDADLSVS